MSEHVVPQVIPVLPNLTLRRDHEYGGWSFKDGDVVYRLCGEHCNATLGPFHWTIEVGENNHVTRWYDCTLEGDRSATIGELVPKMVDAIGKLAGSFGRAFIAPGPHPA